ncbi:unnamed protein product [Discosporangium mesarthrocarpum]
MANAGRKVAKYCDGHKHVHWCAVLSILAYLSTFPDLGVTCGGFEKCLLSAYADASLAGNSEDRQSVTC